MAKWGKKLLGLAAIGGAAAGLVYYLKSKEELDLDDFDDELDDDDFDLDNDLKPVGERGYVPLTPKKEVEDADASDDEEAPDAVEEADKASEEHINEAVAKEALYSFGQFRLWYNFLFCQSLRPLRLRQCSVAFPQRP